MKKIRAIGVAVFISLISQSATAEESQNPGELSDTGKVLFLEGILLANALLASKGPNNYGEAFAWLSPLAVANSNTSNDMKTALLSLAAAEAYAFYYIKIDEDEKSEGEIFRENIKMTHAIMGVGLLIEYIKGDTEEVKNENVSTSFIPIKDGAHFQLSYRF